MNDNNSAESGTGAAGDAARDRAAGERAASGRAEAAKAAKAEEKAAKREAQKAAQEAAAAKRAEKKAARQAKRGAESAQKKTRKQAAKESDEDASGAADGQSEGAVPSAAQGETKETDALPAKVVKGKKPKKSRQAKSSSPKEIRRAIRPIRSRSQQTTARLIWAVFGMALVIVAIAGFWFVLNSQEDTTEIEVLVAARTLTQGDTLDSVTDVRIVTIAVDLNDATISYLRESELESIDGETILENANPGDPLTEDMFEGSSLDAPDGEEDSGFQNEIEFKIEFPGPVTFPEEGIGFGSTRVVIYAIQGQSGSKFAFEVVDIARGGGNEEGGDNEVGGANEIYLRGSYEDRAWWEENFTRAYSNQEGGVSFELEIPKPDDSSIDTLCWRERFRTIYKVEALSPEEYRELIEQLECPESFLGSLSEGPSSTTEGDDTEPGAEVPETPDAEPGTPSTEGDDTEPDGQPSIAERLRSERFSEDRDVPDEFIAPATPSGEESGDLPGGFDIPAVPPFPDVS